MVGRGDDDRVEILLIEHLPIVGIFLGERKLVGRFAQSMLVDIAQSDDILAWPRSPGCTPLRGDADDADIQLVVRRAQAPRQAQDRGNMPTAATPVPATAA